jgi:hypothetical protein
VPAWVVNQKEVREVKQHSQMWRLAARVLVLAMVVTAVPLTSMAGEPGKPAPAPAPLKASIDKAAAANSGALEQAKPPADKSQLNSGSFFKKPVGVAVLAIVGAGFGYMAYSMTNDRIHSVARQNQ